MLSGPQKVSQYFSSLCSARQWCTELQATQLVFLYIMPSSGKIRHTPTWQILLHCRVAPDSLQLGVLPICSSPIFFISVDALFAQSSVHCSTSQPVAWYTTVLQSTKTKKSWDTIYGPGITYLKKNLTLVRDNCDIVNHQRRNGNFLFFFRTQVYWVQLKIFFWCRLEI